MKATKTPDFQKQVRAKPAYYGVGRQSEEPVGDLYTFPYVPETISLETNPQPQPDSESGLTPEDIAFFEEHKIPLYKEKHAGNGESYNPYRLLNKRFSLAFFGTTSARIFAIALAVILISPLFIFAVGRANDYFYVKNALDQAKLFNNANNFQAASVLLLLTDSRWSTTQLKSEISLERAKAEAGVAKGAGSTSASAETSPTTVTAESKKKALTQIIVKADAYLNTTASSLRLEADDFFERCLNTWTKLQSQFPGSFYSDYREGCSENKQTYLNNISDDEKKYTYLKLQAAYLLKKADTTLSPADEALYQEITKVLN